jgi:hypothetical protein
MHHLTPSGILHIAAFVTLCESYMGIYPHPFQQRVTKMWLYPGPSDPNRSFSKDLSDGEINKRILMVLDHGANLNPRAGPNPLIEGVASTRVSLCAWIRFGCLRDFIFSSRL